MIERSSRKRTRWIGLTPWLGLYLACAFPGQSIGAETAPDMPPGMLAAIVIVEGDTGAGTGFVCKHEGALYIVTNQHVIAGTTKLKIRDNKGQELRAKKFVAATDADIVLLELADPAPDQAYLEFAADAETLASKGDAVLIPGNSKGDGVITVTPGKLLAFGPQRVEVDNPVYKGNSGSPIIHTLTGVVIGVLTEVEEVELDKFSEASFASSDSQIKSTIRYFGHRQDTVKSWRPLNWAEFQDTSALIVTSWDEYESLIEYFVGGSRADFRSFKELHEAFNDVMLIQAKNYSDKETLKAVESFVSNLDRLATRRIGEFKRKKIYYVHQAEIENLTRVSSVLEDAIDLLQRDLTLARKLCRQ